MKSILYTCLLISPLLFVSSCKKDVEGCTDNVACNFNIDATINDDSCEYPENGYNCEGEIEPYIGMDVYGGIVFYLDSTGKNGLVASKEDLIDTYEWGCRGVSVPTEKLIGYGYQNTIDIVLQECDTESGGISAAFACVTLNKEGYSDWFLPSRNELMEFWGIVTGLSGYYWSSTEEEDYFVSPLEAYYTEWNSGAYTSSTFKNNLFNVRPIRAFGKWVYGCMDEQACNFDINANFADNSCEYPSLGVDCDGNIAPYVGMEAFGGIVFYVDETGQHGLVAALNNTEGTYEWGCSEQNVTGAEETLIGTGYQNTNDIVNANCISENGDISAAQIALDYYSEGYNDWYLPSFDELKMIINTIAKTINWDEPGYFGQEYYWSSTEYNPYEARACQNIPGAEDSWDILWSAQFLEVEKDIELSVRPIRSF